MAFDTDFPNARFVVALCIMASAVASVLFFRKKLKPMHKFYSILTSLRARVLVLLTHNMALPMLRFIRRPQVFPYTAKQLKEFPTGTLGNDLIIFLENKNLKLLPHYAKHDVKHILLQYDTTGEGEVCLQCFMLGNGHISFPVAATVLYGFTTMPEYWKIFMQAYRRGKKVFLLKIGNGFLFCNNLHKYLFIKLIAMQKISTRITAYWYCIELFLLQNFKKNKHEYSQTKNYTAVCRCHIIQYNFLARKICHQCAAL